MRLIQIKIIGSGLLALMVLVMCGNADNLKQWDQSSLDMVDLKPITKEKDHMLQVKEWLDPNDNYSYHKCAVIAQGSEWIEIPEGAVKAYLNRTETINFVNADDDFMNSATKGEWIDTHRGKHEECGHVLVWSRHTQPEKLPFVDDEVHEAVISNFKIGDSINHPSHYASSSIECIDAMQAMLTPEQFIGYLRGNIFKYQWRYENKGGIQDLEKSQWYLNSLLSVLQS